MKLNKGSVQVVVVSICVVVILVVFGYLFVSKNIYNSNTSVSLSRTTDVTQDNQSSPSDLVVQKTISNQISATTSQDSYSVKTTKPAIISVSPTSGTWSDSGIILTKGQKYTIAWSSEGLPKDALIQIELAVGGIDFIPIVSNLPITQHSYSWTVDTSKVNDPDENSTYSFSVDATWSNGHAGRASNDFKIK